jgi:hypothetical protein
MTFITRKDQVALLKSVLADREQGETFFYWHVRAKEVMYGTNSQLTEQMKIWRRQRKEGKLKIEPYNNVTKKINGEDWYILVVQDPIMEKNPQLDPIGMGFDGGAYLVSGLIYCFKSEHNRDATYKFVMGLK